MIILIKHRVDWEFICQKKQIKINKYNIHTNIKLFDHDYKVGDKVILNNYVAYAYETPYKGSFMKKQCWNSGMVTL